MDFRKEKIVRRITELSSYRYTNKKEIQSLYIYEDADDHEKPPPFAKEGWETFDRSSLIEGRNKYFWFTSEIDVPPVDPENDRFLLLIDFTKFIGGRVRELEGFEALAYINGKPYQGIDQNHKEVFIDPSYANSKISFSFMLWTGLEAGGPVQKIEHRMNSCSKAVLSKETDDLYYNLKLLLKTAGSIEGDLPEKEKLLSILDKAVFYIDWQNPGSKPFYLSVKKANQYVTEQMRTFDFKPFAEVTGIGHTHIDLAWLWQLKHTREKAARSFSTVLRLMDDYPDYTFLQSQPQIYAYIKEDFPEMYEKIKERIEEGRWEADGAMWVEPDCNVPSGESLVRQIIHGANFVKNEFGKKMHYLWLPDVFGYSWALPQILKKAGIDLLMTTKLSWNQYNRMPNDTFTWRGIDGSEILTHFITTPNPTSSSDAVGAVYSGLMEPATVKGVYRNYKNKEINSKLLIAYGHGDGGGGTDREMMEMFERMKKYSLPTLPKVKKGSVKDFFTELKETFSEALETEKSVWDGELYLEYHRGTYTSQARVKKENRKLELAYREHEMIASALEQNTGIAYPKDLFDEGWTIILRNQFHDILPGCAINEVYQDNKRDYSRAFDLLKKADRMIPSESSEQNNWTIYNSSSWNRSTLITLPYELSKNERLIDETGETVKSSAVENGTEAYVENIPPFGIKQITVGSNNNHDRENTPFTAIKGCIESPYYIIRWNKKGNLTSIYDKEHEREVLKSPSNIFQLFEDKPMAYDAWDIDIYYQEKQRTIEAAEVKMKKLSRFKSQVCFTYTFNQSKIEQTLVLYSDSRRIDFETEIDWQERQQVLKTAFDVDIRSTEATYDIQFGNVKRPTHWNTSWDKARFESVGHQWVDLSERDYGISLLNDSKYGHDVKNSQMRLTLVTGAIDPDPEADLGKHAFTYSLLPHKEDLIEAKVPEQAFELNQPCKIYTGKTDVLEPVFNIESQETVFVDSFKKAEDGKGYILRFHDHTGGRRDVTVTCREKSGKWMETDLLEEPLDTHLSKAKNTVTCSLKPFEIKTLRLIKE